MVRIIRAATAAMAGASAFAAIMFVIGVSLLLIVLGLLYFMISLWIVKIGGNFVFGTTPEVSYAVIAAAILTASSLVGSVFK
ncbi:MAG: hypothetical protein QW331_03420 [Candidatus Woesearchaeota archaeon]